MSYRLFNENNEVVETYESLESCKTRALNDNRNGIRWEGPADHGPQGAAKHWYGYSMHKVRRDGIMQPEREYLVVEWPDTPTKQENVATKRAIDEVHWNGIYWKDLDWSSDIHTMKVCDYCGIDSGDYAMGGHLAHCRYLYRNQETSAGREWIRMKIKQMSEKEAAARRNNIHQHPIATHAMISGEVIKPGTILLPTDVYASTTGAWEPCPCPGVVLPDGLDVVWVRPTGEV